MWLIENLLKFKLIYDNTKINEFLSWISLILLYTIGLLYWHLVYLILKVLVWDICNIRSEFAKKSHNTVTNHN